MSFVQVDNKIDGYFIVTRFNIPTEYSKNLTYNPIFDCVYLEQRFWLFETFTIPSIAQQTMKSFKWIVLFHQRTPEVYKIRVQKLVEQCDFFVPIFMGGTDVQDVVLSNYLLGHSVNRYVIVRIDNDDGLHQDFMQELAWTVQKNAGSEYFISFPDGLQYDINRKIARKCMYVDNRFIAYVTMRNETEGVKTPLAFNHFKIYDHFRVETITHREEPMWLEVSHDSNVGNHLVISMKGAVHSRRVLYPFGIKMLIAPFPYLRLLFCQMQNIMRRTISSIKCDGVTKTARKIIRKFVGKAK